MKKLLILGHAPLTAGHPDYGRVTRYPGRWVVDQALALAKYSQYDVTLVTLVKGATQDYEQVNNGLRIVYLKAQPRFRFWTLFLWDNYRLRRFIAQEKPDLIHAHGIEDAYALAVYKARIPKLLTLQCLYADYNEKNPVEWYSVAHLIKWNEGRALKRFESVIVKSEQFARVMQQYYPNLKIEIVPNTLSSEFLEVSRQKKQLNKLAFVGSLIPRKGLHVISEALETIGSPIELDLHVYGYGGESDYAKKEFSKIRAAGHNIIDHGCVNAEELAYELATSNMLIAPSYAETFGNQVIEAMLCQCHCIVSNDTGMADNVRKYGHGTIIPQKGSKEIADAILLQIKEFDPEKERLSRALAREKVVQELGPQEIASQLLELFHQKLEK